jgi:hypothetical protein
MEQKERMEGLPLIVVTDKETFDQTELNRIVVVEEDDGLNHLSLLRLMANRSRRTSIFSKNRNKQVNKILKMDF